MSSFFKTGFDPPAALDEKAALRDNEQEGRLLTKQP